MVWCGQGADETIGLNKAGNGVNVGGGGGWWLSLESSMAELHVIGYLKTITNLKKNDTAEKMHFEVF